MLFKLQIRRTSLPAENFPEKDFVSLKSQPKDMSIASGKPTLSIVATFEGLVLLDGPHVVCEVSPGFEPTAVGFSPNGSEALVGDAQGRLHVFSVNASSMTELSVLEKHRAAITAIEFSPDGCLFASADGKPEVVVWDSVTKEVRSFLLFSASFSFPVVF